MDNYENESFLKKHAVWFVVLAAFIVFSFLLYKGWDKVVNNEIDGMVTITGHFTCLPYKDTPRIESNECTLGLKSRDNSYYALDVSRVQDANTDLKAEDTIAATGFVRPRSAIKDSSWDQYDIKAIIQVNTLLRTR